MDQKIEFKITGVSPLILHNGELANQQNPIVKQMQAITSKRKNKTDTDLDELARLEFMGGLYVNESGKVVIPGENMEMAIVCAARKKSKGKDFIAGLLCDGNWVLEYDGPKTAEKLFEDKNFVFQKLVKVGTAKIMRTRPIFRQWSLTFVINYISSMLNKDDIVEAVETAGRIIGLCDWRPRYGRYEVDRYS